MAKSLEEQINSIRDRLFEAIHGLSDYQSLIGKNGAPELDPVQDRLEDVVVEFERFVNALPVEARS